MQLPESSELEIAYLSRLFDNMSECYKIFWFQAIIKKVIEGEFVITFEELIDEMITDAWYMVTEYRLNLGPADSLERIIHDIFYLSGLKSSEKKQTILQFLHSCQDESLKKGKKKLVGHVPYRLQAPFLQTLKGKEWNVSKDILAVRINQEKRLMYYFGKKKGLEQQIFIQPEWAEYIQKNQAIIQGWIQFHLVEYLQKRNPSVPGIVNKLYPPKERKLEKIKKYWKLIIKTETIHEIFADQTLNEKNLSIDHFVPWSYVAHDEFWNLHPTTRNINSKKSNSLPDWKIYFPLLCQIQYRSYQMIWRYPKLYELFLECRKEHINNEEVYRKLYQEGRKYVEFRKGMEEVLFPVYQGAKNLGFGNWIFYQ